MQRLLLFYLLSTSLYAASGQASLPDFHPDKVTLLLQDSTALKLFVGPAGVLVKLYADSVHVYSAKEFNHFLSKNRSRINAHKVVMASPKDTPFSALYLILRHYKKGIISPIWR